MQEIKPAVKYLLHVSCSKNNDNYKKFGGGLKGVEDKLKQFEVTVSENLDDNLKHFSLYLYAPNGQPVVHMTDFSDNGFDTVIEAINSMQNTQQSGGSYSYKEKYYKYKNKYMSMKNVITKII